MKIFAIAFTCSFGLYLATAHAQFHPTARPSEIVVRRVQNNIPYDQFIAVSSELLRQDLTLEHIARSFSELEEEATDLADQWHARFDPAIKQMSFFTPWSALTSGRPMGVNRAVIESRISASITTADAARRSLETIRNTVANISNAPTLEIATLFHPRYSGDGLHEIHDGLTHTFSTDGSGDSDGLEITITTPLSWLPTHVRGNGMVLRVRSDAGAGLAAIDARLRGNEDGRQALNGDDLHRVTKKKNDHISRVNAAVFGKPTIVDTYREESTSRYGSTRGVFKRWTIALDAHILTITAAVSDGDRDPEALLPMNEIEIEFRRVEPLFDEIISRMSVSEEP